MESLGIRQQRQVYLITYSRANLSAFPTRQSFATAIINAFETTTVAKVLHWVVAIERHNDDCEEDHGSHLTIILRNRAEYHLILSRRGRRPSWLNQGYSARLSRIIVLLFNIFSSTTIFRTRKTMVL